MDPVPGFEQKLFHPPVGVCFDTPLEAKELRVWGGWKRGGEGGGERQTERRRHRETERERERQSEFAMTHT